MSRKNGPFHNERIVFQALLFSKKVLFLGGVSPETLPLPTTNSFCFVKLRNHHGPFAFLSAVCAAALMVARSLDVLATLRGKCQSAEFGAAGLWLGDRSHVDPFGGEGGGSWSGGKRYIGNPSNHRLLKRMSIMIQVFGVGDLWFFHIKKNQGLVN